MNPATPMFIGKRLTEAREARQFTMTMLADRVGVSGAMISECEKGTKKPSVALLMRIANKLDMPIPYFLKSFPSEDPTADSTFFRSMASATRQARQRAKQRHLWLRRIVQVLAQFIRFPAASFPDLGLSSDDPRRLREEDIEHAAIEARRYWNLGEGPIPSMVGLLESAGGFVVRQELGADKLDSLSRWDSNSPQPYFILGSDKSSLVRSRFDAAHELGHMILHRKVPEAVHNNNEVFAIIEQQAHQFAGSFLLPEQTFADDFLMHLGNVTAFIPLKSKWLVSIQAMFVRAARLRLISPERSENLWRSLSRQGWRLREPLDDELAFEAPCLIQKSFDLALTKGIINHKALEIHLGLMAADIESVCGLQVGYFDHFMRTVELESPQADDSTRILKFPGT